MMMLTVMTWASLPSGPPRGNKTYELLTETWYKWLKIFLLILYFPHVSTIFFPLDILYHIISSCRFYLFISLPGRGEMTLIIAGRVADKQVLHISFPQRSQSISPSCVFPLKTNPAILFPPDCPPVHLRLRTACFLSHHKPSTYYLQSTGWSWASAMISLCCSLTWFKHRMAGLCR